MSKGSIGFRSVTAAAAWLLCSGLLQAQIYKTVDEDGNVVYTDRRPAENARPMDLPGLSVIETVRPEPRPGTGAEQEEDGQQEVTSVLELRRGYRDFAIASPVAEQTYWGTGGEAVLAWTTRYRLQSGMSVTFYLDGVAQPATTTDSIMVNRLNRGEHTVYAELIDARNRKIATTETVTFYIQQYSINYGANRQGGPGSG